MAASGGAGGCEVVLQNPCAYPEAGEAELAAWLERLISELAPGAASFAVRFASDREMRRLHRTFRGRDYPTDVLSFPGEATPEGRHLGDVVISLPVARRQAAAAGHATARELRVLLLHGVLHCLGHDHESDDGAMDRLEAALRERWIPLSPEAGGSAPADAVKQPGDAGAG